ncbi:hypothetical protein niasHT_028995 [Heterodera trifolii]|uniref:Uncharacterized protein n=1 Tax=Heterodera trifolii TaxID=157864 RepID=A0ABD2KRY2_9BILA
MDFNYSAYYNALVFDFKKHYGQMFDPSQTSHQRPFNKEAVSDFLKWRKEWHNLQRSRRDPTPPSSPKRLRAPTPRPIVGLPIPVVEGNRPVEDASSDDDDADDNAAQQNIVQRQGQDIDARAVQRPIARVPPGFRQTPVRPFPPLLLPRQGPQVPHRVFPVPHPHVQHPFLHVRPLPMPRQGPPMPYNALHAPQHPIRFPIVNVPPLALPPQGPPMPYNALYAPQHPIRFPIVNVPPLALPPQFLGASNVASRCACSTLPSSNQRPTTSAATSVLRGKQCCVMLCLFNITIIQSTAYHFRYHIRGKQCCVMLCLFNITIIQSTAYHLPLPHQGQAMLRHVVPVQHHHHPINGLPLPRPHQGQAMLRHVVPVQHHHHPINGLPLPRPHQGQAMLRHVVPVQHHHHPINGLPLPLPHQGQAMLRHVVPVQHHHHPVNGLPLPLPHQAHLVPPQPWHFPPVIVGVPPVAQRNEALQAPPIVNPLGQNPQQMIRWPRQQWIGRPIDPRSPPH